LVTVAASMRSILFWTSTIGIVPHSANTLKIKG